MVTSGLVFTRLSPSREAIHKASEKLDKLTVPSKFKSIKEKKKAIVEQLEAIKDMDTECKRQWRDSLHATDPYIVEAHELLGKEVIEKLAYSNQKIKEAMIVERIQAKDHEHRLYRVDEKHFSRWSQVRGRKCKKHYFIHSRETGYRPFKKGNG